MDLDGPSAHLVNALGWHWAEGPVSMVSPLAMPAMAEGHRPHER